MERWRMMYEGMEFCHDVNEWKPLNWELSVQARKVEMEFFKKMGVCKKVLRDVAEKMDCKGHHPKNVWTRTRVIRPGQTLEAGSSVAR